MHWLVEEVEEGGAEQACNTLGELPFESPALSTFYRTAAHPSPLISLTPFSVLTGPPLQTRAQQQAPPVSRHFSSLKRTMPRKMSSVSHQLLSVHIHVCACTRCIWLLEALSSIRLLLLLLLLLIC